VRSCTVCRHKDQAEIAIQLVKKVPFRHIASQYGVSTSSLQHHKRVCMPLAVQNTEAAKQYRDSEKLLSFLETQIETQRKLMEACDRYLTDPDNPRQYTLGPRAEDIDVVYWDTVGGDADDDDEEEAVEPRMIRRKAILSDLLKKAGVPITQVNWKTADPRELILKASMTAKGNLEFIAQLIGLIKKDQGAQQNIQINVFEMMPIVRATLMQHPAALAAVDKAMRDAMNGNGHGR
jgi:hypothetical protein